MRREDQTTYLPISVIFQWWFFIAYYDDNKIINTTNYNFHSLDEEEETILGDRLVGYNTLFFIWYKQRWSVSIQQQFSFINNLIVTIECVWVLQLLPPIGSVAAQSLPPVTTITIRVPRRQWQLVVVRVLPAASRVLYRVA